MKFTSTKDNSPNLEFLIKIWEEKSASPQAFSKFNLLCTQDSPLPLQFSFSSQGKTKQLQKPFLPPKICLL